MKLSGVTVVDLSQYLPGPMLTLMMADQGARVIKVEPPGGEPARHMGPFQAGHSVWFRNLNRGKEAAALDLKSPEGKAALLELVKSADVFVESFRPGVMARLGFSYDTLKALNPGLIYCSITAFGQEGSQKDHAAHDMAAQALSGLLSLNDGPDGAPVVPNVPAADMAASLTALAAVLMALIGRGRTGRGDYIDAAMLDSLLPWCGHVVGPLFTDGAAPRSQSQRSLGGAAFYNIYETADGRHIVLAGREMKFVRTLLEALGRPDLIPLGEAEAGEAQAPLKAFLAATFKARSRDDWAAWFQGRDVAFAPVLDLAEAFASPLFRERGLLIEAGGAKQIGPAVRFREEPGRPPGEPPVLP